MNLPRSLIRIVFTFAQGVRRALWQVTGPPGNGVHAVPLTPQGRVVLVRLTYAPGWRLPGGGRKRGEAAEDAMLRELREEIGLVSHGVVERIEDVDLAAGLPANSSSLFRIQGVRYRPRLTLEVEEVREFEPRDLPDEVTGWTRAMIAAYAAAAPLE